MAYDVSESEAHAVFASVAVAKLIRHLNRLKVLPDGVVGELAAAAQATGRQIGTPQAVRAMEIVQAKMGLPDPAAELRQRKLDEAEEADPSD